MYFETAGKHNTQETMKLAIQAAKERGIGHIVVASNTGEAVAPAIGSGLKVVCVTRANGTAEKGQNDMPASTREKLEAEGVKVLTTTHVLSGAERGISRKFGGAYPVEIIAHTLRMFGQGMKVCVECSVMALDAGLIPYGEKIVAVGGTGRGADTAVIMTPAHANDIFGTFINEIICKPEQ